MTFDDELKTFVWVLSDLRLSPAGKYYLDHGVQMQIHGLASTAPPTFLS